MSRSRIRRPNPALVVSTIALVVALGGTSYAALSLPRNSVGTKQLMNSAVTKQKLRNGSVTGAKIANGAITGAEIANGAITGAKINFAALGTVPSAKHALSAETAANANFATTAAQASDAGSATHADSADTASNADSLGGIAASGYTRSDCSSTTGQIKGFAYVPASASFSSTFKPLSVAYNCSGQAVVAKRISAGVYEVKFPGNPALIAVGNVNANCGAPGPDCAEFLTFDGSNGDWQVGVDISTSAVQADVPFEIVVP